MAVGDSPDKAIYLFKVIRMGYNLKGLAEEFLLGIAKDISEFLVELEPLPVKARMGQAHCGLIKGCLEFGFLLFQGL